MKNLKLGILNLLLILTACNNSMKTYNNELERMNLFGKVKELTITEYDVENKFGEISQGDFNNKKTIIFSTSGIIEEEVELSSDSSVIGKTKFVREKTKFTKITYDKKGEVSLKQIEKFDSNGYLIEDGEYTYDGRIKSLSKFKNDEKGHQIEQLFYEN